MKWFIQACLFLLVVACAKESANEAQATGSTLKSCLSDKEVTFISSICDRFEQILQTQYPDAQSLDEAYSLFVKDYKKGGGLNKIHPKEDMEDLSKITDNPLFKIIWKNENGIWVTDRDGKYFKCIYSKAPNSPILKNFFEQLTDNPGLSPVMVIQTLMPKLNSKNLQSDEIRTMMALHLYAEQGLNLYNLNKKQ